MCVECDNVGSFVLHDPNTFLARYTETYDIKMANSY